jgi:hypothetical protein
MWTKNELEKKLMEYLYIADISGEHPFFFLFMC